MSQSDAIFVPSSSFIHCGREVPVIPMVQQEYRDQRQKIICAQARQPKVLNSTDMTQI
jgi:hypothetical protein